MKQKQNHILQIILFLSFTIFFLNCTNGVLDKSKEKIKSALLYYSIQNITQTSFTATFYCSTETKGVLAYGIKDLTEFKFGIYDSKFHTLSVSNLKADQEYSYSVSCGEKQNASLPITKIKTMAIPPPPPSLAELYAKGIWILGGVGPSGNAVGQVDFFDAVSGTFNSNFNSIPTPRINAGIVSNSGKIYVIGGLIGTNVQSLVEEFDPNTNIWRTMANIPVTLQGFTVTSIGTDIYLIGGTTTNNMVTGTLPPFNVYRFSPFVGASGTWASIVTSTALVANIEMGGCALDGIFYFTGGRYYLDGSATFPTNGYTVAGNTTTTINEAPISVARHGMSSTCYRPIPTDAFPLDAKSIFFIGGSISTNLFTPITAIVPSNVYNYYLPISNTMNASPIFPISVYAPASEISYSNRKIFVFGGSSIINVPLNTIYSMDLANPISGPWLLETLTLPIARFGHKAVILSR